MAIDIIQLAKNMTDAASKALGRDVATLRNFSERQVEAIARQTVLIKEGIETGGITEATRDYFLDSLEEMARTFVKTLRGLQAVAQEKIYNAIAKVIWSVLKNVPGMPPFLVD